MAADGVDVALCAAAHVAGAGVDEPFVLVKDRPIARCGIGSVRVCVGKLFCGADGSRAAHVDHGGAGVLVKEGRGLAACDRVIIPIADASHLAAAEDGATDGRVAGNVDFGVGHTTGEDVLVVFHVALAGAEDVAHALVAAVKQLVGVRVTDARGALGCAAHVDGSQSMRVRGIHQGVVGSLIRCIHVWQAILVHTDHSHTSTAEDGALDGSTAHGDVGVAAHTTAVLEDSELIHVVVGV